MMADMEGRSLVTARQAIERTQALAEGLTRYFTGRPCKYGHVAERLTSSRDCLTCSNEKRKSYRQKNIEKERIRQDSWTRENRDKVNANNRRYKKANTAKGAADSALRRADKRQRTPCWLTDEDRELMEDIYALSQLRSEMTGVQHHVDHVIPLRGELVSGLHTPWNMQILTAADNVAKGNAHQAA